MDIFRRDDAVIRGVALTKSGLNTSLADIIVETKGLTSLAYTSKSYKALQEKFKEIASAIQDHARDKGVRLTRIEDIAHPLGRRWFHVKMIFDNRDEGKLVEALGGEGIGKPELQVATEALESQRHLAQGKSHPRINDTPSEEKAR